LRFVTQTNTFQAVLVTDGCLSFVMFNYGELTWDGDEDGPVAGVSMVSHNDGIIAIEAARRTICRRPFSVSGKKETKMFSVISSIKHG